MLRQLREDVRVAFERDPAAKHWLEVLLAYPGLHALWVHRLANRLYRRKWHVAARVISHLARFLTGVEIHPGAKIGPRVFIDHGMGVVIGETAEIGPDCTLYQGVTLGGTGKEKGKRHPTLEQGVIVGVGAKVLGPITVGAQSRIGGGAVVVKSVPPHCTVVGIPGRVVIQNGVRVDPLAHGDLPDPVTEALRALNAELAELKRRLEALEKASEPASDGRPDAGDRDDRAGELVYDPRRGAASG